LDRISEINIGFEIDQGENDQGTAIFKKYEMALDSIEESQLCRATNVHETYLLTLWEQFKKSISITSTNSRVTMDRFCTVPKIAMSSEFLRITREFNCNISEVGIGALVRSYHISWGEMVNRLNAVEAIRSMIAKRDHLKSPRIRLWSANLASLVDTNDVDNLSLQIINKRQSPLRVARQLAIDPDTSFFSAVVAMSVRRICQKLKPSPGEIALLTSGLLEYRSFRPSDLGRAISNAIMLNRGSPPTAVKVAVVRLTESYPMLGASGDSRQKWETLLDKAALEAFDRW
jgi:hypothetical protein